VLAPRVRQLVEERVWRARLGVIRDFEHGRATTSGFANLVVARTIADTLAALDPRYPPCDARLAVPRLQD
jgi:hypothetical protein